MTCGLTAYWISYPEDWGFPMGQGVTAYSTDDAFRLLEAQGYDFHLRARRVDVKVVTFDDLDDRHVVPNMGPIVVRGVWFPCLNVGYGAPRG
ncbi:MAG TPA: hypothetical protein VGM88_04380 [Kofleriaceae bacterium]|jgi:hypothetical protein